VGAVRPLLESQALAGFAAGAALLGAAGLLLLALAVPLARRAGAAGGLLAGQGACLAAVLLAQAWLQGSWQLLAVAGGTVAVKLVALPRGARMLAPALGEAAVPGWIVVAGVALALPVVTLAAPVAGMAMAAALAVVLLGALLAALRRDAVGQVAGVLTLENGLVLALAALPVFPGVALLALAALALPGAMVVALLRRVLPEDRA
jgi:hydrogenase-4 component E